MPDTSQSAREVDTLLARFPGPVTLVPSRRRLLIGLALCLGLTVFCVAVLIPKLPNAGGYDAVMTVLSTVVCAGLALRAAILLFTPATVGLTLNTDGFTIGGFFRRPRRRWRDVGNFRVEDRGDDGRQVMYDALTAATGPRPGVVKNAHVLGNVYGLPEDDLAWLMGQWRERALAAGVHSVVPHIAQEA